MFILEHQDGNIGYEFETGGFATIESKLYISVEAKAVDEEAFPDRYLFAIDGYPITGRFESFKFEISTNLDDVPPNVYVYTTFHASEVEASLDIQVISEDEIEVSFCVISEDVNYYNEKAKPNPFKGAVRLSRKNLNQLWVPA